MELVRENEEIAANHANLTKRLDQLDLERDIALACRQLATTFEQKLICHVLGEHVPKPSAQPYCIKSYKNCFKFLGAWEFYVSAANMGSDDAKRVKFNKDASNISYGKGAVDAFLALPIDQQEAALARLNLVQGLQSQVVYNFICVKDLGHGAAAHLNAAEEYSWDEVIDALQANGYEDESCALSELHQLMNDLNLADV